MPPLHPRATALIDALARENPGQSDTVRTAFGRVAVRNERSGTRNAIDTAIDAGVRRAPRQMDVFVHHVEPMSIPWSVLGYSMVKRGFKLPVATRIQEHLAAYQSRLLEVLDTATDPMFVNTGLAPASETTFEQVPAALHSKPGRSCESIQIPGGGHPTGFLNDAQFALLLQLMDGMHPQDRITVHGAYAGACVIQFATQLAAARLFGQHQIAPFADPEPENAMTDAEAVAMGEVWLHKRVFAASGIKTGVIFDSHKVGQFPSIVETLEQLKGDRTQVFPGVTE